MIIYNGQTELIEGDGMKELNLAAESAALLFADNGWTWQVDGTPPDSDAIVRQLISLMVDAIRDARGDRGGWDRGWGKVSGGRLYASATRHDDPDGVTRYVIGVGVEFVL